MMMNEKADKLLADVRAYTVELTGGELTDRDCELLQLMVDVFKQIRADGAPDYPITQYVKRRYGFEKDNDGQSVIYLDESETVGIPDNCPSCGEPFEVQVEDGEECLRCQAENDYPIGMLGP